MRKLTVVFTCQLLCVSAAHASGGYKQLSGSYAITSENIVDPGPEEKKDRLVLFIEGDAAREVFDSMDVPVKKNDCDPALRTKSAGGLVCSVDLTRKDFQCTVGVKLGNGSAVKAVAC